MIRKKINVCLDRVLLSNFGFIRSFCLGLIAEVCCCIGRAVEGSNKSAFLLCALSVSGLYGENWWLSKHWIPVTQTCTKETGYSVEILLEWGHLMTVKEGFVITAYVTSLLNERSNFYLFIFSQCDCVYPRIFDTTKIPLADIVQWKNVCI